MSGGTRPGWLRRLWSECRRYRGTLAGIALTLVAGAAAEIIAPLLTKWAVDSATDGATRVIGIVAGLLADAPDLPRGRGSVEQRTDNVAVLVDPAARRAAIIQP